MAAAGRVVGEICYLERIDGHYDVLRILNL